MSNVNQIPRLRFPGFDDGWEKVFLGEICKVKTGGRDTKDKKDDGKYPFFVRSNTVERIDSFSYEGEAILTSGDGVGVGKNFHYINGKFDYHQRVYALKDFKREYSAKFIYQVFSQKFYRRVLSLSAKNSVDSVRLDFITKMNIDIPSLPEQQKIASFLSSVDKKIELLQQKKVLLEQYKKGVMQKIFNQELRFKDDNGKEYPDWEERKLENISKINPKNDDLPKSFIYIDLESVNKGFLTKKQRINVKDAPSRAQRVLEKDDILFQTVRPYQMNNFHFDFENEDFVASTGYAQVRAKESSRFLYYVLHTFDFVKKVLSRCTGTSYPAINSTDLGRIFIKLPSVGEQVKIANFLSAIDSKIQLVNTQLTNTQGFKKGLLQQMFV